MKEKEKNQNKVEEQPIQQEEQKTTTFTKVKKVGKWVGIALAGAGLFGTGFFFGKKSATPTTTETETI